MVSDVDFGRVDGMRRLSAHEIKSLVVLYYLIVLRWEDNV